MNKKGRERKTRITKVVHKDKKYTRNGLQTTCVTDFDFVFLLFFFRSSVFGKKNYMFNLPEKFSRTDFFS